MIEIFGVPYLKKGNLLDEKLINELPLDKETKARSDRFSKETKVEATTIKPQNRSGELFQSYQRNYNLNTTPQNDTIFIYNIPNIHFQYNSDGVTGRKSYLYQDKKKGIIKHGVVYDGALPEDVLKYKLFGLDLLKITQNNKVSFKKGGLISKFQKPAGGIHLVGKPRSSGIREWFKEWWNDYPKDYSGRMCAIDAKGNPTGECAKYSNDVLKSKGYKATGDAWTRIPFSGAKVLYTGYDDNLPETYDNATYTLYINDAANRFAEKVDTTKLRDYDIVGMTSMGSPSQEKAYNAGKKHGRLNTHTGHIRVGEDGTHYVVHNVHNNVYQHKLADLLGGNKVFSVVEAARPKK